MKHERIQPHGIDEPEMLGKLRLKTVSTEELIAMFRPCAAKLCLVFSPSYRDTCVLAHGHEGDHGANGRTWKQGEEGPEE